MDFTDPDRRRLRCGSCSGKPRLAVVDCRFDLLNPEAGRQAYLAGHIPDGALCRSQSRSVGARRSRARGRHPLPDAGRVRRPLGRLGIGNDTQVIAYDDANGSFAARGCGGCCAGWGIGAVAVLDGGFKAWIGARRRAASPASRAGRAPDTPFTPRLDAAMPW